MSIYFIKKKKNLSYRITTRVWLSEREKKTRICHRTYVTPLWFFYSKVNEGWKRSTHISWLANIKIIYEIFFFIYFFYPNQEMHKIISNIRKKSFRRFSSVSTTKIKLLRIGKSFCHRLSIFVATLKRIY